MAIDPICGMSVDEKSAASTREYARKLGSFGFHQAPPWIDSVPPSSQLRL